MAEGIKINGPVVCEHVTKMGRFSPKTNPNKHSKRNNGPQFRTVPYQDLPYLPPVGKSPTPKPESPRDLREPDSSSPRVRPTPNPVPRPAFTPYVEMKLGRNMRAAPKGSISSNVQASDINQQFLIETLNRNSQTSLSNGMPQEDMQRNERGNRRILEEQRLDEQRQREEQRMREEQRRLEEQREREQREREEQRRIEQREREQRRLNEERERELRRSEEQRLKEIRRKWEDEKNREESVVPTRHEGDFDNDHTFVKQIAESAATNDVSPSAETGSYLSPAQEHLYSSYKMSEFKPNDLISTQPLTSQKSESLSRGGETNTTTSLRGTVTHSEFQTAVSPEKQETVDEVEIAEDIQIERGDSDDGNINEDDFNF